MLTMRKVITACAVPVLLLAAACGTKDHADSSSTTTVVTKTVTATAPAPPSAAPTTTATQPPPVATLPSQYVGKWPGHTRQLNLNSDGTGSLSVFSGAMNGTVWDLTWTGSGSGIAVTLVRKTKVVGDGAPLYYPGQVLTGSLSSQDGGQVLTLAGVTYCDDTAGRAGICGA